MSVLTTLSPATLRRCRQIILKTHSEYFHGPIDMRRVDQLIDALGEETIRKLMDNADLARFEKKPLVGAVKTGVGSGSRFMERFVVGTNVKAALLARDPDEGPSAEVPGRNA